MTARSLSIILWVPSHHLQVHCIGKLFNATKNTSGILFLLLQVTLLKIDTVHSKLKPLTLDLGCRSCTNRDQRESLLARKIGKGLEEQLEELFHALQARSTELTRLEVLQFSKPCGNNIQHTRKR